MKKPIKIPEVSKIKVENTTRDTIQNAPQTPKNLPTTSKNVKIKEIHPQISKNSPEALISLAINKGVSVETLERLVALKEKVDANNAKKEYDRAMAQFQAKCPVIIKKKEVKEKDKTTVRYKYAPLDSIVEQTKSIIAQYGLSYTIQTDSDKEFLTAICRVTHTAGHSEDFSFKVPIGNESFMSDVQKYGARLTFAKRYAFCNAFGILTGDDDNDAPNIPSKKEVDIKSAYVKLMSLINQCSVKELKEYKKKVENSNKYTENQQAEFCIAAEKRIKKLELEN